MKKGSLFRKKTFHILLFCIACFLQIIWLIGIINYGDLLIGTSLSIDYIKFTIGSNAFFVELGLFCIANILMVIVSRCLRKWELAVLIILVLIEFGTMGLFAIFWFSRVWIRHPPTSFGLGYLMVLGLFLSVPIIIHVVIIICNRTRFHKDMSAHQDDGQGCQGDGSVDTHIGQ